MVELCNPFSVFNIDEKEGSCLFSMDEGKLRFGVLGSPM